MNKLTIETLDVKGKRVLCRVDFNVPLNENQEITDDRRITAALPTIEKLIEKEAKVILMSHLGRPKGEVKPEFSLKPVAERLSELLGKDVQFASDCIGPEVEQLANGLADGEVLLLENLRFHKEETENDPEFSQKLASLGDVYVNDAFGTAHRAHASTEGVTKFIDVCAAGYLMQKELDYLGNAIANPERPFTAILGGAKISGKIDVIQNLFNKVDTLIIGGGMAYTFLKAMDYDIGKSLLEEDKLDLAKKILKKAETSNVQFLLPVDVAAAEEFANDSPAQIVDVDQIPEDMMGLDIGPKTIKLFKEEILRSKTIVWNGPMGVFEFENFAIGTNAVAEALAEATENGAITIIGGGDSAAAIKKAGLDTKVSHVSTGGGASLEFLEGKTLPGVAALTDA
ncbi:MAG: phosphoglycerate kinase [Ignavibacteria bacterium]|nr:MAG: phosphoglycerate kinase [Ignavibacteria bacterium]